MDTLYLPRYFDIFLPLTFREKFRFHFLSSSLSLSHTQFFECLLGMYETHLRVNYVGIVHHAPEGMHFVVVVLLLIVVVVDARNVYAIFHKRRELAYLGIVYSLLIPIHILH